MALLDWTIESEPYIETSLGPGLRAFCMPKAGFHYKSAVLSVAFGSADLLCPVAADAEPLPLPYGTAHFLEHRLFERDGVDISDQFASLGAEVNAHTSYTGTDFVLSCVDGLPDCLDLLLDLVFDAELSADAIARERDIITKEIELYGDNLDWVSYFATMRALYPDEVLAVDMAGNVESVSRIDSALLRACHHCWYRPTQMTLFLAGDFVSSQLLEAISHRLSSRHDPAEAILEPLPRASLRHPLPCYGRERCSLDIARPRLCLGFRDPESIPPGSPLLRRELAADLALDAMFGPASDFCTEFYEQGLLDLETFGYDVYVEPEFAYCIIGGDTDEPALLEEAILSQLEKALAGGLDEDDFTRIRRKAKGSLIDHLDDVGTCSSLMQSAVSRGGTIHDFFGALETVSLDDVHDVLTTWLASASYGSSLVEPRSE